MIKFAAFYYVNDDVTPENYVLIKKTMIRWLTIIYNNSLPSSHNLVLVVKQCEDYAATVFALFLTHQNTYTHTHTHAHACTHTSTHAYTHTHTNTHTNTNINTTKTHTHRKDVEKHVVQKKVLNGSNCSSNIERNEQ